MEVNLKKDEALYCADKDVRARTIWNPPEWVKILGGTINYNLIKAAKIVNKHFISGKNMSGIAAAI